MSVFLAMVAGSALGVGIATFACFILYMRDTDDRLARLERDMWPLD